MNKLISLFVVIAIVAFAGAKPQPKPDILAYNVAGVPVVATAPAVATYATVYEQTFHGNVAPASYLAYSTYYDPYLSALPVPVGASVLLKK